MEIEDSYLPTFLLPILSEVLAKLTLDLQMRHCRFFNSLFFQNCKVVNAHIHHSGIKKAPKNSMPSFVKAGLISIRCSRLTTKLLWPGFCSFLKFGQPILVRVLMLNF